MLDSVLTIIPVLFPVLTGAGLLTFRFKERKKRFAVRHGHIRHQPKHGGRKRPRIEGPGQRNIKASGV